MSDCRESNVNNDNQITKRMSVTQHRKTLSDFVHFSSIIIQQYKEAISFLCACVCVHFANH